MELPITEVFMVFCSHRMKTRKNPAVKGAAFPDLHGLGLGVEAVKRSIISMEFVDVPHRQEHLRIGLSNTVWVEFHWVPWCASRDHVPTGCICSFSVEVVPRVNDVATGFGHLLAFCIQDQTEGEAAFVGHVVKDRGRNGQQRVEPSSRLVHAFTDVVDGERGVEG